MRLCEVPERYAVSDTDVRARAASLEGGDQRGRQGGPKCRRQRRSGSKRRPESGAGFQLRSVRAPSIRTVEFGRSAVEAAIQTAVGQPAAVETAVSQPRFPWRCRLRGSWHVPELPLWYSRGLWPSCPVTDTPPRWPPGPRSA
eukprot:16859-Prorocentrum_minimum.AAC.1